MAKKAKKTQTDKGLKLKIVNPNAAGIDIASGEMQVCVPQDRDGDNNRTFGSFTNDLKAICKWLKLCQIDTVAMESTGIYWIPLYFMLQQEGFDVILCDAKSVKNYSGRKTDESDAEWIMLLHSYGLLKACFQPENTARMMRNLTRHRNNLLKSCSKETEHMQKSLDQMNIKLCNVISDLLGKSGQSIISAIINGNHDARSLSTLADSRCKASPEIIEASLNGTWDEDHLFTLRQSYELYQYIQEQIKECDNKIEALMSQYKAAVSTETLVKFIKNNKRIAKKNAISFDVQTYAFSLWGINPLDIPGMSNGAIMQLIGELGHDFTEKFETATKFCSWCNLVPNNKISGGKLLSSKVPKHKNHVGQIFRLCANSLKSEKTTMGFYFRRIQSKSGYLQAIVATAHKLAKVFYTMVKNKTSYDEKKVGLDEAELLKRKIQRTQLMLDRLNRKINGAA